MSKVKGPANDEHVDSGKVRRQDKKGTDHADNAANAGTKAHGAGTPGFLSWIHKRRMDYAELVLEISKNSGRRQDSKQGEDSEARQGPQGDHT